MESLSFAYIPLAGGTSSFTIDALYVVEDYDTEETLFSDINLTLRRYVDEAHKIWSITSGRLTEDQQNLITELRTGTGIEFTYNTVTYDVLVKSANVRHLGATLVLVNLEAE